MRIAFTIAYLLRILHSKDPELEANLSYEAIQRALPAMQEVGFQEDLVSVAQSLKILRGLELKLCLAV